MVSIWIFVVLNLEDYMRLKENWKYIDFYEIVRYTKRNYIFEEEEENV